MKRALPLLVLALPALGSSIASAHTRSISYSRWELGADRARIELRVPQIELTRFPTGEPPPDYFASRLRLFVLDQPCEADEPRRSAAAVEGWVLFRWSVRCESAGERSIRSDLFSGIVSHTHFARVAAEGSIRERFLVESQPIWTLRETHARSPTSPAATALGYVPLGLEHILTGWDHLAFLLALLLLARSLREVATLVTGFTIAHSLTLGLAAFGALRPVPAAVEVLIGFSIALVAAENLWILGGRDPVLPIAFTAGPLAAASPALFGLGALPWVSWLGLAVFSRCHFGLLASHERPARIRAAVAFAFGLVHGFGFAGVLMDVDLPRRDLVPALFGFNSGVELGQLAAVGLVWPLLVAVSRSREDGRHRFAEAGSAAIFALGVFWIVSRAWG